MFGLVLKIAYFPHPASQEEKQVTLGKSETIDHFREFAYAQKNSTHGRMIRIMSLVHED